MTNKHLWVHLYCGDTRVGDGTDLCQQHVTPPIVTHTTGLPSSIFGSVQITPGPMYSGLNMIP